MRFNKDKVIKKGENMKRNIKILIIIFFSSLTVFVLKTNTYGFDKNEEVKTTVFCYDYTLVERGNSIHFERKDEKNKVGIKAGKIITFIQSQMSDGICQVKTTDGEFHYIKEVNLEKVSQGQEEVLFPDEMVARDYVNKYKDTTLGEFKKMDPFILNLEYAKLKQALKKTNNLNTQLSLKKIINTMAEAIATSPDKDLGDAGLDAYNKDLTAAAEEAAAKRKEQQEAYEDQTTAGTPGSTLYTSKPELNRDTTSSGSLDDLIGDADSFVSDANTTGIGTVDTSSLQNFSQVFYNILLEIGIAVAVIVGIVLGIKFMTASVEEKADIKQLVVPYIVGCIVVFGGFGIWAAVVGMLENI